jgi:hypothetical protein
MEPRASAWARRSSTCDKQRAAPRATAWVPRSSTCDAQRAAPRATALAPQLSTCDAPRAASRATAWADAGVYWRASSPQAPCIRLVLCAPPSPASRIALTMSGLRFPVRAWGARTCSLCSYYKKRPPPHKWPEVTLMCGSIYFTLFDIRPTYRPLTAGGPPGSSSDGDQMWILKSIFFVDEVFLWSKRGRS